VPRFIAVLGLVGGPLICASAVAVMFGAYEQLSAAGAAAALPVFAWELGLAGWLIVRGFGPGSGYGGDGDAELQGGRAAAATTHARSATPGP
jgi:hypothetical protein